MLTQRIQAVKSSSTLRITALAKELQAQGKKVVNLAAGEPDFDTPEPIKAAAIQAIHDGFTKYTPTTGIPELRRAVADFLKKDRKLTYEPNQINITCGAKQAIFNLLMVLVQSGDEVLIPSPYWVSYPEMVRLTGATPVEVRTDGEQGFQLQVDALKKAVTSHSRCLILNSPSNPTGVVMKPRFLEAIAQWLQETDLWVISDEIYSQLVYGVEHRSIAGYSPEVFQRTILVDGFSKAYAMTGWRMGYLAGPVEVVEAAGRLQDHSTSNPTSISQKAALAALTSDPFFLRQMVEEFRKRRDLLMERLKNIPKLSAVQPEGAFYSFIDISATGLTSTQFSERLLQEAWVALVPGAAFGWDTHVRVSFATGIDQLKEGMDRIEKFVKGVGAR